MIRRKSLHDDRLVTEDTLIHLPLGDGSFHGPVPRRQDDRPWLDWGLALATVLLLHWFWTFWLHLEPIEPSWKPPIGPTLHVLTESSSVAAGFEPVMLSLPSPFGFSGTAMPEEIGARPSLQQPHGLVQFLTRLDYNTAADWETAAEPPAPRGPPVSSRALDVIPPGGTVLDPGFWSWSADVTFEVSGDATAADIQRTGIPPLLTEDDDASWAVEASLEFDARGAVRHAFIEQASDNSDRDRALLRSLYGWRLNHDATASHVHVRVSRKHMGRGPAAPPPDGSP